jgi:hypothetical protein
VGTDPSRANTDARRVGTRTGYPPFVLERLAALPGQRGRQTAMNCITCRNRGARWVDQIARSGQFREIDRPDTTLCVNRLEHALPCRGVLVRIEMGPGNVVTSSPRPSSCWTRRYLRNDCQHGVRLRSTRCAHYRTSDAGSNAILAPDRVLTHFGPLAAKA